MSKGPSGLRHAEIESDGRNTKVYVNLGFDAGTKQDVNTGHPFFDRMLTLLGSHGDLNLGVSCECEGDPDGFLTSRTVGQAVGSAIRQALGSNPPVKRYASTTICSGESLVVVTLDLNARYGLVWSVAPEVDSLGLYSTLGLKEFFQALAANAGITLHVHALAGTNSYHQAEAIFKGFGLALASAATSLDRKNPYE